MYRSPLVSVLLPAYNASRFLDSSLRSILNQTFTDFEILLINDASTDSTEDSIRKYRDARIRYIKNSENIGISASLNKGLDLARGEYVARMDADDIAHPHRLESQVRFMERHSDILVCGTWARVMGTRIVLKPEHNSARLRARLLFESPLLHPTAMLRLSTLREGQIRYDEKNLFAEDYDLWARLAKIGKLTNLRFQLLQFRTHAESVSSKNQDLQRRYGEVVRRKQLSLLGIYPSEREMRIHLSLARGHFLPEDGSWEQARRWCETIATANIAAKYTSAAAMHSVLKERLLALQRQRTRLGQLRYSICRARQLFLSPR
jgi:glycosyltransferase involved in cell wall biosynthesis